LIRIDELLRELEAAHPADKPETLRSRHQLDARRAELLVTKFDGWFKAAAQRIRSPFRR
jgi:hypothetical protein